MKLTLIILNTWHFNTKNDWYGFSSRGGYAPSAMRVLASLIPQDLDVEVEFRDENIERINFESIQADLVGISVLTANAPRAYQVSDDFRKRGIKVVLGGYHVTALPEEAIQHADSVVVGFAERSFPILLRDFVSGNLKKFYNQNHETAFLTDQRLVNNPGNYRKQYLLPDTLEITRGCYNNCSFCVIPSMCGNYVKRPIASVVEEIKFLESSKIVFLDFSPFEDPDYALELFEALKPLKIRWYSSMTTKNAENEAFLEKAAGSGCSGVLIGFETINPGILNSVNKKFNHPEQYFRIVSNLHKHHIWVLGSFIFGFDEDDKQVFKTTLDFNRHSKIDMLHYAILTPFPGTRLFEQLKSENRISTFDWSKYDGTHVVFQPAKMTADELQQGFFEVYRKSHSLAAIAGRTFQHPSNMAVKLAANLGFRLYIHSFIKQYRREKDNIH